MATKPLSIRLEAELHDFLTREANSREVSATAVVTEALREHFEEVELSVPARLDALESWRQEVEERSRYG